MEDLRLEGRARRMEAAMTAVIVDGEKGREYRTPTPGEIQVADDAKRELNRVFAEVPFGLPEEPLAGKEALGLRVPLYGLDRWWRLFTPRQLVSIGSFVKHIRLSRAAMQAESYPPEWEEASSGYLAMSLDRLVDRCSSLCQPDPSPTQSGIMHTFSKFALPMNWDFIEGVPISNASGGFAGS